jgi:hypothetical protein
MRVISSTPPSGERREEFRLWTIFFESDGHYFVAKRADSINARPFLESLLDKDSAAEKFFAGSARVLRGRRRDELVCYPRLECLSVCQSIANSLQKRDWSEVSKVFDSYINFLSGLPNGENTPVEFYDKFWIGHRERLSQIQCFTAGPMDCIPSNVLQSEDGLVIIDNEWFFDFPIPRELLTFRAIASLVFSLQREIVAAAENGLPAALFSGYGTHRHYTPISWSKRLDLLTVPAPLLAKWNLAFEQTVFKQSKNLRLRHRKSSPILFRDAKGSRLETIAASMARRISNMTRRRPCN